MSKRDYYEIAERLIKNGTNFQKEYIKYYMKYFYGSKRDGGIIRFIDIQINLGNIQGV